MLLEGRGVVCREEGNGKGRKGRGGEDRGRGKWERGEGELKGRGKRKEDVYG